MSQVSFGQLLVQAGHITRCQLQSALAFQRAWNGRFGLAAALVKLGFLSTTQASELAPAPQRPAAATDSSSCQRA